MIWFVIVLETMRLVVLIFLSWACVCFLRQWLYIFCQLLKWLASNFSLGAPVASFSYLFRLLFNSSVQNIFRDSSLFYMFQRTKFANFNCINNRYRKMFNCLDCHISYSSKYSLNHHMKIYDNLKDTNVMFAWRFL